MSVSWVLLHHLGWPSLEQLLKRAGADESVLLTRVTNDALKLPNTLRGAVFNKEKLAARWRRL